MQNMRLSRGPSFAFLLFLLFLAVCALCGGASRADVASLVAVRLSALAVLAHACLRPPLTLQPVRAPLALLLALAGLILLQLVPLPPALWAALPGHAPYAQGLAAAGLAPTWRPLNLTPDLGWNAFLALLPPVATLVGIAGLSVEERLRLLPALVAIALASAVLGVVQLAQGPASDLYLYSVTNRGSAVGLFANRNHQALLLALALPALAALAGFHEGGARGRSTRGWAAMAVAVALLPVILVTGSRAGLVLGTIGVLTAGMLAIRLGQPGATGARRWLWALPVAAGALLVGTTILLARATALKRLFQFAPQEDARVGLVAPLVRLAREFVPLGSGFGTFETVWRQHEPFADLGRTYLNHAHNDLAELAIEGGLPALALLGALVVWWGRRAWAVWRQPPGASRRRRMARLGAVLVPMTLAASLPDYPLRTPLIAVVFAIACGWLGDVAPGRRRTPAPGAIEVPAR